MIVPDHVAKEHNHALQQQKQLAMMEAQVRSLHINTARGIFERIIAGDYAMSAMAARQKARSDADRFGTLNDEDLEERLPETIPVAVDVRTALKLSVEAANAFVCGMGLIDQEGNVIMPTMGEPAPPQPPHGIVLGD